MGYANYNQYDSRWGNKVYNGSSTMSTAGCGPTSVANLVHAVNSKIDPWDVALYMKEHGYAIYGHGTAWDGIPAAMKHFGLEDVKKVTEMSSVWAYLSKGYCAVFLFRDGSRGNIVWTTSGHFVAVTGYKRKDGNHVLYTRDSGGRGHTGWYTYETQMRGLISQVWVGKVPAPKTNREKLFDVAMDCAYKKDVRKSTWSYPGGTPKRAYKNLLDKVFPSHHKWKQQIRKGASCAVFAATVIRATGDKSFPCNDPRVQLAYMAKSGKWKKVSWAKAKPGDIIVYLSSSGSAGHIMVYKTKHYLIEASYAKAYPHVKKVPKRFKTKAGRKSYYKFAVYRRKDD